MDLSKETRAMLNFHIEEGRPLTKTVALEGRLDTDTADEFDKELKYLMGTAVKILVFDMAKLDFVSSAGLSSLFRVQKEMKSRGGKTLMVHLQPQVRKVFEIVKTVDLETVFRNVKELDEYLDAIQNKSSDEN
jgi:anti-anti-sigma factor